MTTQQTLQTEEYKQTELGELPKSWEVVRLGDVAKKEKFSIVDGPFGSQMKVSDFKNTGIPLIEMQHLKENSLNLNFRRFISQEKFEEVKRSSVLPGDIIISKTGTLGLVAIVPNEIKNAIITSRLAKISFDKNKIDLFFSKFILLKLKEEGYWEKVGEGSTMKVLTISKISNTLIPLPPLQEQQKIAYVLSTIQQAQEKTDAVIIALRELKKAMMKHLFTYGPVSLEEAKKVKLKETEIGAIPENWRIVHLGDIGNFQYGYTETSNVNKVGPKFLRITDIDLNFSKIFWETVPYCKIEQNEYPKYLLRTGDILIARIGATTGKTCLIRDPPESVFASYLIRFISNKTLVDPVFIYYFTVGDMYWNQINANKEGKLKKGVSSSQLKNFKIPLPSIPIQQQIVSILSSVDEKIQIEQTKKNSLDELFKSMLHNLMTAKIRVNHLRGG